MLLPARAARRTSGSAHAPSSPSAAPGAPRMNGSGSTAAATALPPTPQSRNSARTSSGPWRSSSRQPNSPIATDADELVPAVGVGEQRRWRAPRRRRSSACSARSASGTHGQREEAEQRQRDERDRRRTGRRVGSRAEAGDLAPSRSGSSVGPGPARGASGGASPPSRSIFGARLRSRVPQYGHSVMYGLTSDPHFLQTTKRSGAPVIDIDLRGGSTSGRRCRLTRRR